MLHAIVAWTFQNQYPELEFNVFVYTQAIRAFRAEQRAFCSLRKSCLILGIVKWVSLTLQLCPLLVFSTYLKGKSEHSEGKDDSTQRPALAGDAGKDYKAKYRSLIFNLRDPSNPELRARVLKGEIPSDKLVQLSAEGLASKVFSLYSSHTPNPHMGTHTAGLSWKIRKKEIILHASLVCRSKLLRNPYKCEFDLLWIDGCIQIICAMTACSFV